MHTTIYLRPGAQRRRKEAALEGLCRCPDVWALEGPQRVRRGSSHTPPTRSKRLLCERKDSCRIESYRCRADSSYKQRRAMKTAISSSSLHGTMSQSRDREILESDPLSVMLKIAGTELEAEWLGFGLGCGWRQIYVVCGWPARSDVADTHGRFQPPISNPDLGWI